MARLVHRIQAFVHDGVLDWETTTLDVGLNVKAPTFRFHAVYPVIETGRRSKLIEKQTILAIRQWLGYPVTRSSDYQGHFICSVIRQWSISALYLDATWDAFKRIIAKVIGHPSSGSDHDRVFRPLISAMQEHPLASVESYEYAMVYEIRQLVTKFGNADFVDTPMESPSPTNLNTNNTVSSDLLDTDTTPRQSDNDLVNIHEPELQRLLSYIDELYPLVATPDKITSVPNPTILQAAVYKNTDKLLPFRERAPSREFMLGDISPFSLSLARTRKGLFSAALWRGITYNSQFSHETSPVFDDLTDWNNRLASKAYRPAELGLSDHRTYFCDKLAYGHINGGRKVELADQYWIDSDSAEWTSMLDAGIIPFMDCYHFFTGPSTHRFLHIGPLAGYLITADYVYAGLVEKPSIEEMGEIIWKLNKGGAKGLSKLGIYLPAAAAKGVRRGGKEDCIKAFECVYSYLSTHLSQEKQKRMGFDVIMVEHLLCKYHRAVSKGLFKR